MNIKQFKEVEMKILYQYAFSRPEMHDVQSNA